MDNNSNYKGQMGVNDSGSYPSSGYRNDDQQEGSFYDIYGRDYFETDRKEKSLGMAVLCGLLTCFASLCLLLCLLAILFASSIKGVSFSQDTLVSPFETTGLGDIKIGSLIKDINSEAEVRNNITVAEYIYEKLPASIRKRTSSSEIASVLNESGAEAVAEFFEKKSKEYADVLNGDAKMASITAQDVIDLVEKYKNEAEKILGHEPNEKDYEGIEKFFEDNKIEQSTTLKQGSENKGVFKFTGAMDFIKNKLIVYCILAAAVCLLLILLFNLEEKRKVFSKFAFCAIFTAVVGFIIENFFDFFTGLIFERGGSVQTVLKSMAGNIRNAILRGVIIFAVLGVISLVIYIIMNEICARRENKELMERFNDGRYM